MIETNTQTPIEKVTFQNSSYLIKRDDLIDDHFSGNKARKLFYYLHHDFKDIDTIVSYGSQQSNAMYSLSVLAKLKGVSFIYYVDHIASFLKEHPHGNYYYALKNGMQMIEGKMPTHFEDNICFIPEGGAMREAEYGVSLLGQELAALDVDIFLPSGTGTTALYLQKHLKQRVYTCACVGDSAYLKSQFLALQKDEDLHPTIITLDKKYHFGKLYREFFEIWIKLKEETAIEFDLLYDPLGWMHVTKYKHDFQKPLLYIHQGGLIGNESMLLRYKRRFSEDN